MGKELKIVKVKDKKYFVLETILHDTIQYYYLSNVENEEDLLILKQEEDKKKLTSLSSKNEFDLACNLLLKFIGN